ncbi:MAG: hypothetical protein LQ351_003618 [Letrouitia transgressa]|nr:MAG: hypothetical protein LQ351_003618 [Letrouitia transgressa]
MEVKRGRRCGGEVLGAGRKLATPGEDENLALWGLLFLFCTAPRQSLNFLLLRDLRYDSVPLPSQAAARSPAFPPLLVLFLTMYHLAKSLYLYATSKEGKQARLNHSSSPLPFFPFFLSPSTNSQAPPKKKYNRQHPQSNATAEYSILLLGLDNAGKTTLLSSIKSLYHPSHPRTAAKTVPTVGQNVSTVEFPDMYLRIWDVGGQLSLRNLWRSYYAAAHAIVFVVDSTDLGDGGDDWEDLGAAGGGVGGEERGEGDAEGQRVLGRLEECRLVLESVIAAEETSGVPVLVLANKQDREDCVETVRIKEGLVRRVFEGEKGGAVRDSRVLPVSALRGDGVREAVEWVQSRVKWNREGRPPVLR